MGALGLLIGPGIAGGVTVLGVAFTLGGNFGGAKLILVAKVIGGLVAVDVLDMSPLVSFVGLFVVPLSDFFAGAEIGRLKGFDKPLVNGDLLTKVDVRGVVLVFGVVLADFEDVKVFGVVDVLVKDVDVVLAKEVRGVVGVVLADVGREAGIEALGDGFRVAVDFVAVDFKVVVFGTVAVRALVIGLDVDEEEAVVGLDNGFVVVVDIVVFLRGGVDVFEANGFVEVFVVVVLALGVGVSPFLGADFLVAKLTPATAAIAAAPAAATAIPPI